MARVHTERPAALLLCQPESLKSVTRWRGNTRESINTSDYTLLSLKKIAAPPWLVLTDLILCSVELLVVCGCCSPGAQLHPLSDLVLFIYCVTLAWRRFTVEVTIGAMANRAEQDVPFMIYDAIVFLPLSFNDLFSIKIRLS